jgi:hypothetical protein
MRLINNIKVKRKIDSLALCYMVPKSILSCERAEPCFILPCGRRLLIVLGTREPREQMCVLGQLAMLIRALTYPRTTALFPTYQPGAVDSFFSKHFLPLP